MSLIAEYECEACGQHVAFDSDEDCEPFDEGLCKICYDNEFVVYCVLHFEGELDYEMFVNIKDDSSIRSYIRENGEYEKGTTVTIEPLEYNSDIQEEIDFYTSEGRNQFTI
ncbi:hypothetical protein [Lysinibacillus sp. NPDC059133]|uniref:hypothetical protein n=1 Tax=Lysinibacillus sp. NPDC059133 TaxID=3346737 RepID=UPI003675097B